MKMLLEHKTFQQANTYGTPIMFKCSAYEPWVSQSTDYGPVQMDNII